jgi:hypothetical protein
MQQQNLGRSFISLAALITIVAPILADWNKTHIFNPHWPPHARFHAITGLGMALTLAPVSLWLAWQRSTDSPIATTVAALIPIAYWGPFFLAAVVPGAAVEDPDQRLVRIAGVPMNVLGAGATVVTAALGWYLDRQIQHQNAKQTVV